MAIEYDPSENPTTGIPFSNGQEEAGLINKKSEGGAYTNESVGEYATAVSAANNAKQSEINAAESETNAATSANLASSSATASALSASLASNSESNASASETNAASSAIDSANSATASATSATASQTAQTAAETAQGLAEDAQAAAETAETNASISETNAATSESNAANSASNASTSETNAATSESNAATSESNASTSESNAAASESAAALSAAAASTSETNAAASASSAADSEAAALLSEQAAQSSEDDAETAQVAAELAQTSAETAETAAEVAQSAAETAQTASETAQTAAESAQASATASADSATASASSAASSAVDAQSSEDDAETSATAAASSASAASSSASAASTSATAAATSATQSATSATASATSATESASSATASAASASESEGFADDSETSAISSAASASDSATSATESATSATNAATSATASAASATASAASATEAATSESNAATSESNASTSETNAATSETNAGNSATSAASSASSAATSALNAENSATAAASSETNAAISEANSATSETNAASSASAASASATAAANSASAASTSETNAAASESAAATSESNASTSETNAANSASAASLSASAASTSETNAATSETNSETVKETLYSIYLGTQTSDPSVDLNGDPVSSGAFYYNTTLSITRIYNGTAWVNGAVDTSSFVLTDSDASVDSLQFTGGTGDQGTVSWNTDEETLDVILDGATLQLGQEVHYHVRNNSGSTISNGTPVYATGTLGNSGRITVSPFIADGTIPVKFFLGVTTEDIADGTDGKVTNFGKIRHLDTSAFNDGDILYPSSSTAGALTSTAPTGSNISLPVAFVIHAASNGTLFVRSTTLDENAYATAAQGDLADSSLQPSDVGSSVQAYSSVLDNTTASYTVAEESKLAGIEAGATGDQTASEILTALKTVDGAGSGLDADLLDGQSGSYYTDYADAAIANLVDTAPSALDTLNELSAALGDDPNFATTVSTNIGTKVSKSGDTMTGNLNFGDNDKAVFGAGSDLQIYHDGANSRILETGQGFLAIGTDGSDIRLTGNDFTEYMAKFEQDGAATLYYDNAEKLATTSTGVDVTGTVTADGLTFQASEDAISWASGNGLIEAPSSMYIRSSGTGNINLGSDGKAFAKLYASGDFQLTEDTGTTAKFFWDASAERLGIGTSSPTSNLEIDDGTDKTMTATAAGQLEIQGDGYGFGIALGADGAALYNNSSSRALMFGTNETERMRIDGSGNVGIGTTSPSEILTLDDTDPKLVFRDAGTERAFLQVDTSDNFVINNKSLSNLIFETGDTERMRIDSSGNLLVGKTTNGSNNVGFETSGNGQAVATTSGISPLLLNRTTSDGDIAVFRKNGATVGSIGVGDSDNLYISGHAGNTKGLYFNDNTVGPAANGYNISDATTNLGASTGRFKDLYLSGNINVGGTVDGRDVSSDGSKLDGIASGANNYTHPSYAGDDINLDTGALSGATVISDLDFNVTTDTLGHVTDANATYSTRNLTASDIGAAPASHTHSYLPLSGGTVNGNIYLNDSGDALIQKLSSTSNYGAAVKWYKGGVSQSTYDPQIGQHNTGGTGTGAITILPYPTTTNPWGGSVGVYISEGVFKYKNQNVFRDDYHPNADKWTTARTLSLTGDVTGSTSWDGSGNASITATVADNSHSHSNYTPLDHMRSTGNSYYTSTTTSALLSEVLGKGSFNSYFSTHKTGWSYAGNGDLTDAGRLTELAGTSWAWWTDNSGDGTQGNVTALVIAPNTGGSAGKVFIYNNQGSGYSPGWREVWTSTSDGSGSGLDADLLDGLQASEFPKLSSSNSFTNSYNEFGNSTGSVSNDGNWNARVNVAGSSHARLDVKSVSDGIITSVYSHTGNNAGKIGTMSNHPLKLMVDGSDKVTINSSGNVSATSFSGNGSSLTNVNADTVDGLQASQFLRSDADDTLTGNLQINSHVINMDLNNIGDNAIELVDVRSSTWPFEFNTNAVGNDNPSGFWVGSNGYPDMRLRRENSTIRALISSWERSFVSNGFSISGGTLDMNNNDIVGVDQIKHEGDTNTYMQFHAADQWRVVTGGSERLEVNNSNVTINNATLVENSDIRQKTDIEPITDALAKVKELGGYTYVKDNMDRRSTGVIAQEVLAVLPEAVTENDEGFYSVAYSNMVGLLIEAIKEQQGQIDDLKQELAEIKSSK